MKTTYHHSKLNDYHIANILNFSYLHSHQNKHLRYSIMHTSLQLLALIQSIPNLGSQIRNQHT